MTNLLFPTDFLTANTAALDWVRLFARKTGATITLVHVYRPMVADTTLPTFGDIGMGVAASQEVEEISRRQLDSLAATLQAERFSVQANWRIGSVEEEILAAATEFSADLIVMGRNELSTFFDRLAGSAISDVTEKAICPVLVVPTTGEGHAVRPAQVRTIAYAMQAQTQQSDVSAQTDALVKTFDADLKILTEDQIDNPPVDLIVMQLYPQAGFLDNLLHPNHTAALVETSDVPVLVYHQPNNA